MNTVYILIPLLITSPQLSQQKMYVQLHEIKNYLYPYSNNHENNKNIKLHKINNNKHAVEFMNNFNLTFLGINELIEEVSSLKNRLCLLEQILRQYEYEPNYNNNNNNNQDDNMNSLIKKVKKYKQVKEQNQKLKKLLQIQLDNTEKVREQTQKTMKVLREQFDSLVGQIANKQKQKQKYTHNQTINEQGKQMIISNSNNSYPVTAKHFAMR